MSSLRPVATKSATSRQSSMTADQWDRTVLIKVGARCQGSVRKIPKGIKSMSKDIWGGGGVHIVSNIKF